MNKFEEAVAGVLEVESVNLDTRFRETEGWCSLMAFGLLVMMETDWNAPVSIEQFLKFSTVRDLFREAFTAFSARILGVPRESIACAEYGFIPEWDSVNHLRLVMEAEPLFGISYPLERIPQLKSIEDFIASI